MTSPAPSRGSVSLAGLGLVAGGGLLIWSALNDPPGGIVQAFRDFVMTGQAQAGLTADVTGGNASGPRLVSSASGAGGRVIAVAEQYLGDPYLWGGASHKGIDCSGLVMVAYRDGAGVSLPHWATGQVAKAKEISATDVQAGDLVAWGVSGNWPHIALALNQTTCIASWTYGVGVQEKPIHIKAVPGFGYPRFFRI